MRAAGGAGRPKISRGDRYDESCCVSISRTEDPGSDGLGTSFDVGATYFDALVAAGLTWTEMPPAWRSKFRHYGGLTWLKNGAMAKNSTVRARQMAKLGIVEARLRRARVGKWGTDAAQQFG